MYNENGRTFESILDDSYADHVWLGFWNSHKLDEENQRFKLTKGSVHSGQLKGSFSETPCQF